MKFVIESIKLTNWRGAESLFVELNPGHNLVTGTNGTKKSTIAESYRWGFTGKDSQDRKDYDIKNSKRKELNRNDHEWELTGRVDDQKKVIRRVFREIWQRPRGQEEDVFKGNETLFFINDVPFNATQFNQFVSEWFTDTQFKLLSDPLFFNTPNGDKWKWTHMRDILISIAGVIDNDSVYDLAEISKERRLRLDQAMKEWGSLDKLKKEVAEKIKKSKDELKGIPESIASQEKTKPESQDWKEIELNIKSESDTYEKYTNQLFEESKGDELIDKQKSEKRSEIRSIENDILDFESSVKRRFKEENDRVRDDIFEEERSVKNFEERIAGYKRQLESFQKGLEEKKKEKADLLPVYKAKKEEDPPLMSEDETTCQCCGRELEEADLWKHRENFISEWNLKHAKDLATIKEKGQSINVSIQRFEQSIAEFQEPIAKFESSLVDAKLALKEAQKQKLFVNEDLQAELAKSTEHKAFFDRLSNAKSDMEKLSKTGLIDEKKEQLIAELKQKREQSNQTLIELRNKLAKREQLQVVEKEIAELKEKQSRIGQTIADLEGIEFAITKFNRSKNAIVQDRVNKLFPADIHYDLFETQVNGDTNDICEMSYKGVPWGTLNTGGKIYAGCECIKVLSEFYGIYLPVWIDNNESTLELPEMGTQTIGIYVIGQFLEPKEYNKIKDKLFVNGELIQ